MNVNQLNYTTVSSKVIVSGIRKSTIFITMKQQINEIHRMQQLAGLIKESQLNETEDAPTQAKYVAGSFRKYIIPGSEKYTYGPDEEGTYDLEFKLAYDVLSYDTPEKEAEKIEKQIGGHYYSGPGQSYTDTTVSYEGEENGEYVFTVYQRGGYDI